MDGGRKTRDGLSAGIKKIQWSFKREWKLEKIAGIEFKDDFVSFSNEVIIWIFISIL